MKMRIILTYLIPLFISFGCNSQEVSKKENLTPNHVNYKAIRDGLYENSDGNLFFKTVDASDRDNPIDRYIYVVYSDSFGIDGIKEMEDVIDSESFNSIESEYYQDKNYVYYFHVMSDGGTMGIIDEADLETFKVLKYSMYGIDKKTAFYRGTKIEGADIPTFEPIIIEDSGSKIGWYARDRSNYYNGNDIMNDHEIKELKEEIKRLTTTVTVAQALK